MQRVSYQIHHSSQSDNRYCTDDLRPFFTVAAQCACICTACTDYSHLLFNSATVNAAKFVSCVKTIMAAPISNQFRVGSVQVLVSESQQLHALPAAF